MGEGLYPKGVMVGVADLQVAREDRGQLITHALGSCIGLCAYDPVGKVGGLLHYLLPQPTGSAEPKALEPCRFGATGIPMLLRKVIELGGRQHRLILCAAGGAEILTGAAGTAIGTRNRRILREVLLQLGVVLSAEDTGGNRARTMSLDLASGEVRIRCRDRDGPLWAPGMPIVVQPGIPP